ncbi:sigma-70 family RNA polymerase sigma factor [Halobacillus mangrovi]|uniref:sigma-70 family RNA polymerase sigma factor n=1 Tax=Halobacillus mangrovi TaxID=402384 RepID=UPI0018DB0422|nr:sigma-70 family RNA polymerase sigma factor [Halobacillus mangrovi]
MIHKKRSQSYTCEPKMDDMVEEWISNYGHDLKWLAYSYVKDHSIAEDITQETFIKAYQKYPTFRDQSSIKTWLYKINVNLCKDHLKSSYIRRVVKKGADLFRSIPAKDGTPEERLIIKSNDEELVDQVLKLEKKYREIIILYYFEEFEIKELAEVLKTSPNTVKTRLRRARQLLQDQLTTEGSSENE